MPPVVAFPFTVDDVHVVCFLFQWLSSQIDDVAFVISDAKSDSDDEGGHRQRRGNCNLTK